MISSPSPAYSSAPTITIYPPNTASFFVGPGTAIPNAKSNIYHYN